jgi:outer membrane protein assembly factor BamD (BamD/ComL family)
MPISYQDFDLLIERSGKTYKARVVDSPAGEAEITLKLPYSQSDVEQFFIQIGHSRLIESPQTQKMREFGRQLFEATFSGDVRDRLRESLNEVTRKGEGLRIRLRTGNIPELTNMPWEFMYDASLSRFLALSVETPLVRYLDIPRDIQPLTIRPPLRILAMISSPRDFPTLNVQKEWNNLQESLSRLESRGMVTLTRLEKPTLQTLQRQLRREQYHIFHFIGHGVFSKQYQDGFLLFEDELQEGHRVSSRDLGILLHDHRHLRLAVLNACEGARTSMEDQFSGTAQSLMRQGLPAVIAMQFRITDIAAITMAREFYTALADGYPVDAALTEARKAIKTHGNDLEWGTPVLYMRAPNGQIFDVESIQPAPQNLKVETIYDTEIENKLISLYTEGLEAFYLNEWENAITKFNSILSIRDDYKDTASKLETTQHRLKLSTLEKQAQLDEAKSNWESAIKSLEALTKEFPEKTSFASRLENARKQLRLKNLYLEAQQLANAKKWLAVLQVFREIHSLDANYPDPDNLLPAAEEASANLKLQSELQSLYQNALQAIEASDWDKARTILNHIQSKQTEYRETERLLQRANEELARIERQQQEEEKISSLYIQAENLLHRKQWQKSLEKVEEILKLFPGFEDPKQVASQARTELEKANEEAEKQDQLATLYAEAVKLNQAGEYQQALEKWNQIRALDASYPDRQRVHATAQRMLKKTTQSESVSEKLAWRPKFTPGWGILMVGILWFVIRLGALSITDLLEMDNSAVHQLLLWSLFGIATGFLNPFVFRFFKSNGSNKQKIILIGGWLVSSLATPMMVWLSPEFVFRYHIGYTLTGAFYGLVLHYTLPDLLSKPKFTTLIFGFAFGMFVGECSWSWFRYSVDFNTQLTEALTLFVAIIVSSTLTFGKTIAAHAEEKSKPTIEKTVLSIIGITIAAKWLGYIIGEYSIVTALDRLPEIWNTIPYLNQYLYSALFAVLASWFLIRLLRIKLAILISRTETIILAVFWIIGMVTASIFGAYFGLEMEYEWGWMTGWGIGGVIIGFGMWLATKKYSGRNKSIYLITSILGWGGGFFLSDQISWPLQSLLMQFFEEGFSWNVASNANFGFAGLVGGLVLSGYLETGHNRRINWKTVLASFIGFGLGNLLANIIATSLESGLGNVSEDIVAFLQMLIWGLVGGASLAVPSKNVKQYIPLAVLGAIGMILGQIAWNVVEIQYLLLGTTLGLCIGIRTKKLPAAFILALVAILGFAVRGIIVDFYYSSNLSMSDQTNYIILALTAGLTGLILGTAWSFLANGKPANFTQQIEI